LDFTTLTQRLAEVFAAGSSLRRAMRSKTRVRSSTFHRIAPIRTQIKAGRTTTRMTNTAHRKRRGVVISRSGWPAGLWALFKGLKIFLGGHGFPEATLSAPSTRLQPPIGVFDAHRQYAQVDISKNNVLILRFRT